MAALKVAILTTFSTASNENFIKNEDMSVSVKANRPETVKGYMNSELQYESVSCEFSFQLLQ